MNIMIKLKLETLREFQANYPNSCVGGSIGLMLYGINLQRNLFDSDLDITTKEFNETKYSVDELKSRSDNNDFDYCVLKNHEDGHYTKLDIRINYEFSFEKIIFEGYEYNVTKIDEILFWKKIYAAKGSKKHIDDLITIETGIRPLEPIEIDEFMD
jgi:hypothetical protein